MPRRDDGPSTWSAGPTNSPTSTSEAVTRPSYGREIFVRSRRSSASFRSVCARMSRASASAIEGRRRIASDGSTPGLSRSNARMPSSAPALSTHTWASASRTAISAASTCSSNSAASIRMNGSLALIDPPLLKSGETQAMRPTTSDATLTRSSRFTVPVSSRIHG